MDLNGYVSARTGLIASGIATLVMVATPAIAHHSFAMYDQRTRDTLTGRLIRFIPGANHAQLIFELVDDQGETVIGDDGKPAVWGSEMESAAQIAADGVTIESFPLGTIISVTINPLRDGRPFGAQARGTPLVHCGTELPQGGCTTETGRVFLADFDPLDNRR